MPASAGDRPTKGLLGDVMERYFGIPRNNSPEPDFPQARVELKILPLKRKGPGLAVKEATSISMIDYTTLLDETWERPASVRKKLARVLFVFFVIAEEPMGSWVRDVILWEPGEVENAIFKVDWDRTWGMVSEGRAHELSEAQAKALAARRKGMGGPNERGRPQPRSPVLAPSRAWALKSSFTRQILEERVLRRPFESAFAPLLPQIRAGGLDPAEERTLSSLSQFEGLSLASVAARMDIPLKGGKALAASIIKRSLGFQNVNAKIREFEQLGIDVKTLHLRNRDGLPFESVSFPVVDLRELVEQDWEGVDLEDGTVVKEGSDLVDQLQRILFVPTYSDRRDDPQKERRLGRAFFWSPSSDELGIIKEEWEMFREEVREGRAAYDRPCGERGRTNRLTHSRQTRILHMRPHGRNACDEYEDPRGNRVTKQCFWLNAAFVWQLVNVHHAFPPPSPREE